MKRFLLALLALFPFAVQAQIQCDFATNPQPGYVYTYCGPSIGAVWTTPPGGVSGPGITVVGHVPAWADTTGAFLAAPLDSMATRLTSLSSNYSSSVTYGGTANSAALIHVLGSSGSPDGTLDAVAVLQKWSNSASLAGGNPTLYVSNIMTNGSATSRGVAGFFEGETRANGLNGGFTEGLRAHGTIAAGFAGNAAYGLVATAQERAGSSHLNYLIGAEAEVDNLSADATTAWISGTSTNSHFEASFLASSGGTKKAFAAFMTNPFQTGTNLYRHGVFLPTNSVDFAGLRMFGSDAVTWGINLIDATNLFGALGIANNSPIRAQKQDNSGSMVIEYVNTINQLILGSDPSLGGVLIGATSVPIYHLGNTILGAITAPASPPASQFAIYMDGADSKLKAKGPTGTVTVLANP